MQFWAFCKGFDKLRMKHNKDGSQVPKMELLAKKINKFHLLTIFTKSFILDILLLSECPSVIHKIDLLIHLL